MIRIPAFRSTRHPYVNARPERRQVRRTLTGLDLCAIFDAAARGAL